jgi:enamine deaminase RidA (YjgF/YER057c/UK114 family)
MRNVITAGACVCALAGAIAAWNAGADIRYLNPAKLGTPVARFSHAVVVPAGSNLIFVSGQGGSNEHGDLVATDVVGQTRQTMENLKVALEAAGSDFAHVVKMNLYLTDMDHMPELRKVRDAYLDPKRAPAMTTAKVMQLVGGLKVEIEVVAVSSR